MKAVSIEGDLSQKLAAAVLTQQIRSTFKLTSPHDFAVKAIEMSDRYGLDHAESIKLVQEKLPEVLGEFFTTALKVVENKLKQRKTLQG